jgi:thiol-disulfide isomerase/thioredoxin
MLNRILIGLTLIGLAIGYTWWSRRSLQSQIQGSPTETLLTRMPQALYTTLEGEVFDPALAMPKETKAIVVHFWATWCGPCEAELPELLKFSEHDKDIVYLIVAINDEVAKIKKFLLQMPLPSNKQIYWLLDNNQVHRQAFGTTKLPESYVFRGNGQLLKKLVGPQAWEKPQFLDTFRRLTQ